MFDTSDGICLAAGAVSLAAIIYMQAPQTRDHLKSTESSCYSARVSEPVSARLSQPAGKSGGDLVVAGDTSALDSVLAGIPAAPGTIPVTLPEFATNASTLGATSLNALLKPSAATAGNPASIMPFNAPDFPTGVTAEPAADAAVDIDSIWDTA